MKHNEKHKAHRINWLRAAVLGANDGIISIASLIVGIVAAQIDNEHIMAVGIAGIVAGAMSMAAGEYVSVSSQTDIEKAEIALEEQHLEEHTEFEINELAEIYRERGLDANLARKVSEQLMAHDALGAHMRDELGISHHRKAKPIQAALTSATAFTIGAALPLVSFYFSPNKHVILSVTTISLISLAFLGGLAAFTGGAGVIKGSLRVLFWGASAMFLTAAIGNLTV